MQDQCKQGVDGLHGAGGLYTSDHEIDPLFLFVMHHLCNSSPKSCHIYLTSVHDVSVYGHAPNDITSNIYGSTQQQLLEQRLNCVRLGFNPDTAICAEFESGYTAENRSLADHIYASHHTHQCQCPTCFNPIFLYPLLIQVPVKISLKLSTYKSKGRDFRSRDKDLAATLAIGEVPEDWRGANVFPFFTKESGDKPGVISGVSHTSSLKMATWVDRVVKAADGMHSYIGEALSTRVRM